MPRYINSIMLISTRSLLILSIIYALSLHGGALWAQSTIDDDDILNSIIITHDPTQTPMINYQEWRAGRKPVEPFTYDLITKQTNKSATLDGEVFAVLVNEDLYPRIQTSLDQYTQDVTNDGFTVHLYTMSGGSPETLRNFLSDLYSEGLVGAVLVGDLPIPWFEYESDQYGREEFPCDLYYMDLDGTWSDRDNNEINDYHRGYTLPEIWIGRLTASPLTETGEDEADLLQEYFDKIHYYRTANFRLPDRALAYIDDDWMGDRFERQMSSAYGSVKAVLDGYTTYCPNYLDEMPLFYQAVLTCVHSSPVGHYFARPDGSSCAVNYEDIITVQPQAFFYNLFACSNARYIEGNYMAGWYLFGPSAGMIVIGSAKIGSMLYFNHYYAPLHEGKTHGEAFYDWFVRIGYEGYSDNEIMWFYGMTLLGDPTLRLLPSRPHVADIFPSTYHNADIVDSTAMTFDIALDDVRLEPRWMRVYGSYTGAYSGVLSHDSATDRLVFAPDVPFKPNEILTVQADTFVAAETGMTLYAPYARQFRVGGTEGVADDFTYVSDSLESVGGFPSGITATDIDRDGDIDLAVTVAAENTAGIYYNGGTGEFSGPVVYAVGQEPRAIAFADLDNDGDNDMVTANYGGTVSVLYNIDGIAFGAMTTHEVGQGPVDLQLVDFDANGFIDIATCNYAAGSMTLLSSAGDGEIYNRTDYFVGSVPHQLLTFDTNRDGLLDVITLSSNNRITVTGKNVEDLQFHSQSCTIGRAPAAVAAIDFNGDSYLDLAVANTVQNELTVYHYLDPLLYFGTVTIPLPHRPKQLLVGDINGDGYDDFALSSQTEGSLMIVYNGGDGTLAASHVLDLDCHPQNMVMADLDGDAALDFAVVDAAIDRPMLLMHTTYLCGNANGDDAVNIGDAVYMINCVFKQGPEPVLPETSDTNGDGVFDIGDAVYMINFIFKGGPDPICMQ